MSTRSIINKAKLEEWASRFSDQKASGLTVADWCQQNGVSRHCFFYWKRKLRDEVVTQALPEIVPLSVPLAPVSENNPPAFPITDRTCKSCTSCATFTTAPCARVHIGGITVELDPSLPEEFISRIIKAVRHA